MSRGRVLTEVIKKRILELADHELNVTEIAGALHINSDTVRKYLGGKKDVGKLKDHHGSKQKTRKRRPGDPDSDKHKEDPGKPIDQSKDLVSAGESINFTGGKKYQGGTDTMNKKEDPEKELEWECPACHHKFDGDPSKCPNCGKFLTE